MELNAKLTSMLINAGIVGFAGIKKLRMFLIVSIKL
jgi:hypothetical protein